MTAVFSHSKTPVDPTDWLPYRTNTGYSWRHVASVTNPHARNQNDRPFLHVYQFGLGECKHSSELKGAEMERVVDACLGSVPGEKVSAPNESAKTASLVLT